MNRRAGRRGFTLIELLLVVGLLVAIAAIALPSALDTLDRRRFEGEVDELLSQLRSAQSLARLDGAIIEVRLRPGSGSLDPTSSAPEASATIGAVVEIRRVDRAPTSGGSERVGAPHAARGGASRGTVASGVSGVSGVSGDRGDRGDAMVGLLDDASDDAPTAGLIERAWNQCRFECTVEIVLPGGFGDDDPRDEGRFAENEPASALAAPGFASAAARLESIPPRGWRVALFLPDGSAPMSIPLRVRDRDGRQAVIVINPFTGRAAIERVDPAAAMSLIDDAGEREDRDSAAGLERDDVRAAPRSGGPRRDSAASAGELGR